MQVVTKKCVAIELSWRVGVKYKSRSYADDTKSARYNKVNIQMLPPDLHQLMFPDFYRNTLKSSTITSLPPNALASISKQHLTMHKIPFAEKRQEWPFPELFNTKHNMNNIPSLIGNSIEEHFWKIGKLMSHPYYDIAEQLALASKNRPSDMKWMKDKWSKRAGWTQYTLDGKEIGPIEVFDENAIVFDVETCPSHGPWPLLAIAFSKKAMYSWVSPLLFDQNPQTTTPRLISIQTKGPMLVIGHNISYDRARILEEYSLKRGQLCFLDTLSMHCAVGGLSSQQRGLWKSNKVQEDEHNTTLIDTPSADEQTPKWHGVSAMNNLADAVALHCDFIMDKSACNILVKGTIDDVRINFDTLMTYCAGDVSATRGLFAVVWPKFTAKCPHPVTFAALLEMGSCFLPVNDGWSKYIENVEKMYHESAEITKKSLGQLVEDICIQGEKDSWQSDPWLCRLDWTLVPAKYTKERRKADGSFAAGGEPRPIGTVELFGKPAWYKKLWCSKTKQPEITPKIRILPYLMRMKWKGHVVHFLDQQGWCYCVEKTEKSQNTSSSSSSLSVEGGPIIFSDDKYDYYKIPHHEKEGANVGSLMAKHYVKYYEKGILTTDSPIVKSIMDTSSRFSFWTGYRERIKEQFVIWQDEAGANLNFSSGKRAGMIIPSLLTMGTVTRRAVEATWMTATNPKKKLVGSELKAHITAPDGYVFVGADVDSQELWISSLLGDAKFGFAGATALGWMTLQGIKSDGTDLHSRTASILGMSRDDAKIFNYGRIYGAGVKYAAQLLQKFNPSMSKQEADERAKRLYAATKGRTVKKGSKRIFVGGTETFMFNVLEEIANAAISRTPALSASISDALLSTLVADDYLTSRINWAVQSSGVDYLHMLLAGAIYLARRHQIDMRLAITIHDEVRFLVAEKDQYRAALALQLANCWTRTMFAHRVGMTDLPLSVAFFSAVDFDKILRKEPTIDCITPSNPIAVPSGFSLDIYKLLTKVPSDGLGVADEKFVEWEESFPSHFVRLEPVVKSATTFEHFESLKEQIDDPNLRTNEGGATKDCTSNPEPAGKRSYTSPATPKPKSPPHSKVEARLRFNENKEKSIQLMRQLKAKQDENNHKLNIECP